MGLDWNGSSLQTEFAKDALMSTTAEKALLLQWLNETQQDIARRHDWPFLKFKGKKDLTASVEEHDLQEGAPGAASLAAADGGSLITGTQYSVVITFVDSNGLETIQGTASSNVTVSGANLTLNLTSIPLSSEDLVNARRIYIRKDDDGGGTFGDYFFDQEIANNTATTATITTETTSTIEPPDYEGIMKIDGNPFFETTFNNLLRYQSSDQMRRFNPQTFTDGTPDVWSPLGTDRILLHPRPSAAAVLSFYYFRRPARIFAETSRTLDFPPELKPLLRSGIIARSYEHHDSNGVESKLNNYQIMIGAFASKYSEAANVSKRVSDVYGDSEGFSI